MKTFLSEVCTDIIQKQNTLKNAVCILPSERAGVFLKNEFKKELGGNSFLPEMISVETFIQRLSGFKSEEFTTLIFDFYKLYLNVTPKEKQDSFDVFLGWATIVLQDFNEVDRHLVNAQELFAYVTDATRISQWSTDVNFIDKSRTIKGYLSFIEFLSDLYDQFYTYLQETKKGYQGLLYREAYKAHEAYLKKHAHQSFYFIGFNALNKAEEAIFQTFLAAPQNQAYWDADAHYIKGKKESGQFLRDYFNRWKVYEEESPTWVQENYHKPKNIKVLGSPIGVSGIKSVAGILENELNPNEQTALVLADETQLPTLLNSLPNQLKNVNITMGYALGNLPIGNLFLSLIDLQKNWIKLGGKGIYYKDFINVLRHPFIKGLDGEVQKWIDEIEEKNIIFIHSKYLTERFQDQSLLALLERVKNIDDFLQLTITFIIGLKEKLTDFNQFTVDRFLQVLVQIQKLNVQYDCINSLSILQKVYHRLIALESVDFKGEALQGLQLMGMLETRCLDFKNIIITSVNEGVLPAGKSERSFIPFDIKLHYKMPTFLDKDAIFSYHFYRLIQRAENVYLIYNTQKDDFGGGEKSRFIAQLEMQRDDVTHLSIQPKLITQTTAPITIQKTDALLEILKKYLQKGISPTSLNNYILDPFLFYKKVILKVSETEQVEEEIAFNTLGTIVHDTLEDLYKPHLKKVLQEQDFKEMNKRKKDLLHQKFNEHYNEGQIKTGKNRLIYEVAHQFVKNFLDYEKKEVQEGKEIIVLELEQEYVMPVTSPKGYIFNIKGKVDRIDEVNGVRRIVDYKTGKVEARNLKLDDFTVCTSDYKYSKINQVMMYALMYSYEKKINVDDIQLQTGIYSFKNFQQGFLAMNFASGRNTDNFVSSERLHDFKIELGNLIDEMIDLDIPFIEDLNNPYR